MRRYHITHHVPRLMTPLGRMLLRLFDKIGCRHLLLWMIYRLDLVRKLLLCIAFSISILPLQMWCQQTHYQASEQAYDLLKQMEGYVPYCTPDIVGYKTCAFGHKWEKGDNIPEPCLGKCADDLLVRDVDKKVRPLNSGLLRNDLSEPQFRSVLDFSYNLGISAFTKSSLRKAINERHPEMVVQGWFLQYDKAGGKRIKGLTKRRLVEANLFTLPSFQPRH